MSKHLGKGKKLCKNCKAVCAAANKVCSECKTEFNGIKPIDGPEILAGKKITIIPEAYRGYDITSSIFAPAGKCEFKLNNEATEEELFDWADEVRVYSLKRRKEWLTNNALCYYVRYSFNFGTRKSNELCSSIKTLPDLKHIFVEEE